MRCITMMSTLLGKHNVTSNRADWQFGSSRFLRLCLLLSLPNHGASQMTSLSAARTAPIATTFSLCNLIRQTDRSGKHLRIKITNLTHIVSVFVLFVASLCQFDSPVLLCTGCDNGALAVICNPAFHPVLWMMHCNHILTNRPGLPIYKKQE